MKFSLSYLYAALFIGALAILVSSDYKNHNTFNWTENLIQSSLFIVFFILVMGSTLKKNQNKKNSHS